MTGPDLKGGLELLEALLGLHGVQPWGHGPVRVPLNAEGASIRLQRRHLRHQLLSERLLQVHKGNIETSELGF